MDAAAIIVIVMKMNIFDVLNGVDRGRGNGIFVTIDWGAATVYINVIHFIATITATISAI